MKHLQEAKGPTHQPALFPLDCDSILRWCLQQGLGGTVNCRRLYFNKKRLDFFPRQSQSLWSKQFLCCFFLVILYYMAIFNKALNMISNVPFFCAQLASGRPGLRKNKNVRLRPFYWHLKCNSLTSLRWSAHCFFPSQGIHAWRAFDLASVSVQNFLSCSSALAKLWRAMSKSATPIYWGVHVKECHVNLLEAHVNLLGVHVKQ